jgi:trans-aconitate methyltransferase
MTALQNLSAREQSDRALFDRIAAQYCRKDLLPANRQARKLRLEQTLAQVSFGPDSSLLEVGCGAGFAAEYLRGCFGHYHGFDYSSELIRLACELHAQPNVSFECASIESFAPPEKYDVVLMIGVLHHLDDPGAALSRIRQFAKPGAWVVANEPQQGNWLISSGRSLRKRVDRHYSDDQIEIGREAIHSMFVNAGLDHVSTRCQGVFSTPFAEVPLPFQSIIKPIANTACAVDRWLEARVLQKDSRWAWNVIAAGRLPDPPISVRA